MQISADNLSLIFNWELYKTSKPDPETETQGMFVTIASPLLQLL